MRLATARDEIEPLRSAEVRQNEAYLSVLLLARTVTRIGGFTEVTPELVENLFAGDFDHLQRLYERINANGEAGGGGGGPAGGHQIGGELDGNEGGRLGGGRG